MTAVFVLCRVLLALFLLVAVLGGLRSVLVERRREQRRHRVAGYTPITTATYGNLSGRRK